MNARTCLLALALGVPAGLAAGQPALLASSARGFDTGAYARSEAYHPVAHVAADLDGDGDLDVALAHVGNRLAPKISLLRNRGDGTFDAPEFFPTPGETMQIAAADLDGDGDLDLVAAQTDGIVGQSVLVLENDGAGSFAPPRAFATGRVPQSLEIADVDGDGDLDVLTANSGGQELDISVLLNDGRGGLTQRRDVPIAGERPIGIAAGDLDGDGLPEVAVLAMFSAETYLLRNLGGAEFAAPLALGRPPYVQIVGGTAFEDADGDGDLDVLSGGWRDGIALWRNDGSGALGAVETVSIPGYGFAQTIRVADLTEDGIPDIAAVAHATDAGWALVPGNGSGGFAPAQIYPAGERSRDLSLSDVDGDGALEVLVCNEGSLTLTVHDARGGSFALPSGPTVRLASAEPAVADLDGDGDLDIVAVDSSLLVMKNRGDGTFETTERPLLLSVLASPRLEDLDGDGDPDLVMIKSAIQGLGGYDVYVAHNLGDGTFGPVVTWVCNARGRDVEVGDLDGDGDADVLVPALRGMVLLFNDGTGRFPRVVAFTDPTVGTPGQIALGDFDGDGALDFVGGGTYLSYWRNRGDGTFQAPYLSGGSLAVADLVADDLDLDGWLDVVSVESGTTSGVSGAAVWFGRGDGSFLVPAAAHPTGYSQLLSGIRGVTTADVDGDGDRDVVVGAYAAQDVALLRNEGGRTLSREERYGVPGRVLGLATGDFDGDGSSDVAAGVVPLLGTLEPHPRPVVAILSGLAPNHFPAFVGGVAGTRGEPRLDGAGSLLPRSPLRLLLSHARPAAPGLHVLGGAIAATPFFGGVLVPTPAFALPFVTDARGTHALDLVWPPSTAPLYLQSWIADAAAPAGLAASNGRGLVP